MQDGRFHPCSFGTLHSLLLWHVDLLVHPTLRNLTDSFEAWAYGQGFLRQLRELEPCQLLERQPRGTAQVVGTNHCR